VRIPLTAVTAGIAMAVRVAPRAGQNRVAGVRGDAILVRLAAAPVGGAANDELVAFLADVFDRPRRDVTLLSGHQSRNKRVAIAGLTAGQVAARLDVILTK
jgi:uncharacterized protein (TIGR00251 family)